MRILLVEDDPHLGDALLVGLRQHGHAVDWLRDGVAADLALKSEPFDLLVLDLGLPRLDGVEVLRRLRGRGQVLPVLILTARDTTGDKVAGLDAGADDDLVKPIDLDELAARARALTRRAAGHASPRLSVGDLSIDPAARQATLRGAPVELTTRWYSLRRRLLALLLGGVTPGWLVTMAFSYFDAHHEIDELFDAQLAQAAQTLLAVAGEYDDDDDVVELPGDSHPYQKKLVFQLWDDQGRLLLRSRGAPTMRLTDALGFSERVDAQGHRWLYYSQWDAQRQLRVEVGENHAVREELSRHIAMRLLAPAMLGLPLLGLWVWFAIRRGIAPIDTVADQIARRALDAAEREHALAQIAAGSQRVGRLVGQLLTLARLDPGSRPTMQVVSLDALAAEECADLGQIALQRHITLELDAPEAVSVIGIADLLRVLLRNLIDNALRYTPAGGRVEVAIGQEDDGVRVVVRDDGPGIPESQRDDVLLRFHRLAGQEIEGSGLGLSIVARIAELHQAQLSLHDGLAGTGLSVRVFFTRPAMRQGDPTAGCGYP